MSLISDWFKSIFTNKAKPELSSSTLEPCSDAGGSIMTAVSKVVVLTSTAQFSSTVKDWIKNQEGFAPRTCGDQLGWPTIGYGHTQDTEPKTKLGMTCTADIADQWLTNDLIFAQNILRPCFPPGFTLLQNQWDALVSFTFNLGIDYVPHSALILAIVSGKSETSLSSLWNSKANMTVGDPLTYVPDLKQRRSLEWQIYLLGQYQYI